MLFRAILIGRVLIHDALEDLGLELLPPALFLLCNRDVVLAVEDSGHAVDEKELLGERGALGFAGTREIVAPLVVDKLASRDELQKVGIRSRFGLNKDVSERLE